MGKIEVQVCSLKNCDARTASHKTSSLELQWPGNFTFHRCFEEFLSRPLEIESSVTEQMRVAMLLAAFGNKSKSYYSYVVSFM